MRDQIGIKPRKSSLLTLLKDYPNFIQLGLQFGISESYAHKFIKSTVKKVKFTISKGLKKVKC